MDRPRSKGLSIINTYATFGAHFMKKLNNTEADLKKNCCLWKKHVYGAAVGYPTAVLTILLFFL